MLELLLEHYGTIFTVIGAALAAFIPKAVKYWNFAKEIIDVIAVYRKGNEDRKLEDNELQAIGKEVADVVDANPFAKKKVQKKALK